MNQPTVMIVTECTSLVQQGVRLKKGTRVLARRPKGLPEDVSRRYFEATTTGKKWFLIPKWILTVDRGSKFSQRGETPDGGDQ